MLPFCGYNMADYFSYWLSVGENNDEEKLPKIFYVNWFRKDKNGRWLWPGYGENCRVLKWIFERGDSADNAETSPVGFLPQKGAIDTSGLDISAATMEKLFEIDVAGWLDNVENLRDYYKEFGERMPEKLVDELDRLEERLKNWR